MQVSIRSYLTAGVALAGAGAIALSPVNPVDPHIRDLQTVSVSNAAVSLTATVDPITWYTNVFERTAANVENLVNVFNANPAPLLSQIYANQSKNMTVVSNAVQVLLDKAATNAETAVPAALEAIGADLSELDIEGALNTLLNLPIGILGGPGGFLGVMSNLTPVTTAIKDAVVKTLANAQPVVLALWGNGLMKGVSSLLTLAGLFGPFMSGVGSVGTAIQDVIDAGMEGDPIGVVSAIINAPATIADGILNGGYGPEINALIKLHYTGILTGNAQKMPLNLGYMAGPIQTLVNVRDSVVKALGGTLNPVPAPVPVPPIVKAADAAAPASVGAAPVSALRAAADETAGDEVAADSDASPVQGAVTASPKALPASRVRAELDKFSDRTGKAAKEVGDQSASNLRSNLRKVGDNIAKAMKAKPAKHRVGAKNGSGGDAGSGSGSSAGAGSEG